MTEIIDNIRKIYLFGKSCEKLSPFIEFFSETSDDLTALQISEDRFTVQMFASWTPTIWVNLGSPYRIETPYNISLIEKNQDVLLLRNATVTRHNYLTDHIFTVKFFPGGMEAITGVNQCFLKDKIVPVSLVLPEPLIQSLKQPITFTERKGLLENYFLACLQRRKEPVDHYMKMVTDSIDFYNDSRMVYNTSQVAEKMFISSKSINRYFAKVVGTTPKKYFSILRARKALSAYNSNARVFDPGEYGYYDMSHFYKEAIHFTGRSMRLQ
jgi:AraC-like DNA-binding protein